MTDIELTGPLEQARGVIGRYPDRDERFIFDLDRAAPRLIHMLGVRRPLRVTWLVDGDVTQQRVLRPWVGVGIAVADTIIEERP